MLIGKLSDSNMAFAALKQCISTSMKSTSPVRNLATSATIDQKAGKTSRLRALIVLPPPELAVLTAMVGVACLMAIHTAKQQLLHSPSVQISKKKRECIPEVDIPDDVIRSSDKFENKSFLRKVGHIQNNTGFTRSREVESLKSIGVNK